MNFFPHEPFDLCDRRRLCSGAPSLQHTVKGKLCGFLNCLDRELPGEFKRKGNQLNGPEIFRLTFYSG